MLVLLNCCGSMAALMAHHSSQNTSKHVSRQAMDRRERTMGSLFAGMYVCVHMCHVVNLCQLCVAVPLTYDPALEPVLLMRWGPHIARSWDLLE